MFENIAEINKNFFDKYHTLKKRKRTLLIYNTIQFIYSLYLIWLFINVNYLFLLLLIPLYIFLFLEIGKYYSIKKELIIYDFLISNLDNDLERQILEKLIHCKELLQNGATYYEVQREYSALNRIINKDFYKISIGALTQISNDLKIISKEMLNCKLK